MQLPVRIEMLGGFRVCCGERITSRFQSQKTGALLAYLAFYAQTPHPREALVDLLWPEADPESGLSRLKNLLWLLKQELDSETPLFLATRAHIQLDPQACSTDVGELLHSRRLIADEPAAQLASLTNAVSLLKGDLLPGRYEDWVLLERQRIGELAIETRVKIALLLGRGGDPEAGIVHAKSAVESDPLREDSHAALMRLYADAGRPQEALRQYRTLDRVLWDELGEQPSAVLQALDAQIRNQTAQGLVAPAPLPRERAVRLQEAVGGAAPLGSAFYIERESDPICLGAVTSGESVVLIKGPRQVGKTSLLARAMAHARASGMTVITTDLQKMNLSQLASIEGFYRACAETMAEQLDIDTDSPSKIGTKAGPNLDFERFVRREILASRETRFFWTLDEVDRLLAYDYRSEVFGLFRSWHNDRAMTPQAPWLRLTLGVAYATEAHLLISDLNQSPFNVGVTVSLRDFSPEEVADLNRRYAQPLKSPGERERF